MMKIEEIGGGGRSKNVTSKKYDEDGMMYELRESD
jgi:hypothetical protein